MVYEFKFPDVGEGIHEGELNKWRVKEGDKVKEHDIIADVETDKAIVEVPTPRSGTILKLHFKEGDTINVGDVIITIGEEGEKIEEKPLAPSEETHKTKAAERLAHALKPQEGGSVVGFIKEAPPLAPEGKALATPAVRKLAKDAGIDIDTIKGTGPEGRVTESDLKTAEDGKTHTAELMKSMEKKTSEEPKAETSPAPKHVRKYDMYGYVTRVPLKGVRKVIAKHLTEGMQRSALVTHTDIADVTSLYDHRKKEKDYAASKGVKLTFLPFIVKAVISALKEYPEINAAMDEENQEILIKKYYNIGIAVETEVGLMVPVIKTADTKSILQIAKEIEELADKARTRKIDLADLKGGTIAITNIGSTGGGWFATPIPNFPDIAIIALGRIQSHPLVKDGTIQIRKILPLSITFDHRVVDGAQVALFTNSLKKRLEDPDILLLGEE